MPRCPTLFRCTCDSYSSPRSLLIPGASPNAPNAYVTLPGTTFVHFFCHPRLLRTIDVTILVMLIVGLALLIDGLASTSHSAKTKNAEVGVGGCMLIPDAVAMLMRLGCSPDESLVEPSHNRPSNERTAFIP